MSYLLYVLGAAIIIVTLIDIIWTTLWVDGGAGWITDRLTTGIWRRILKSGKENLMNISGPLILTVTLFTCFFLLWFGATVFFAGDLGAIVHSSSSQSITWYQLPYYSGFVVFTLGIGDFTPQTTFFQITTALFSGIGMLMLTLGASYILSIVSAVVEKMTLARNIMGIGESSVDFLQTIWNGKNFNQLDDVLADLNSQITQYTIQIQAFPLLKYYHSEDIEKATTVAIAVLYDSVLVLRYGIKTERLVNTTLVDATVKSINNFIDTSSDSYGNLFEDYDKNPPKLELSSLEQTRIPLNRQEDYEKNMEEYEDKRHQLQKIIMIDHHDWPNQ